MTDFFIGDLHAGDQGVLVYDSRPFSCVQEMDDAMVRNWNNRVSDGDRTFLLGDIGDPSILHRLNGRIVVVMGNHDDYDVLHRLASEIPDGRVELCRWPIMWGALWLSHEPIGFMPPQIPYLNVHAHTHSLSYGLLGKDWDGGNRYFCASAEQVGYTPISYEEIGHRVGYHGMR